MTHVPFTYGLKFWLALRIHYSLKYLHSYTLFRTEIRKLPVKKSKQTDMDAQNWRAFPKFVYLISQCETLSILIRAFPRDEIG